MDSRWQYVDRYTVPKICLTSEGPEVEGPQGQRDTGFVRFCSVSRCWIAAALYNRCVRATTYSL